MISTRLLTPIALAAAVCALAGATPAWAKDDPRIHFELGTKAFALGRYAEAADEYEKAYDLKPDAALLYNAAQARRLSGNKQRALLLYQSYITVHGAQVGNRREVERHIAALRKAIEAEEQSVTAPPITTVPPGGQARGDEPSATPTPRPAPPRR